MSTHKKQTSMIAAAQAPQNDWLQNHAVQGVLGVFRGHTEGTTFPKALIVGGAVRNLLMGHPVKDIDIATSYTPQQIMDICQENRIKAIPTGLAHGTVTVLYEGQSFEITSLRQDVETDGRHAVVSFTDDWAMDAARRDFTMNALYMDASGQIYDPLGTGVDDAKAGRVIFVGDAAQRIKEDYLRILRFFRFWAIYDRGKADITALKASESLRDGVLTLSKERITSELMKIMMAPRVIEALDLMAARQILPSLFSEKYGKNDLENLVEMQCKYKKNNVLCRLYNVVKGAGNGVSLLDHALCLSNAEKAFLKSLDKIQKGYGQDVSDLSVFELRRRIYEYGVPICGQFLLFNYRALEDGFDKLIRVLDMWSNPVFPVSGHDLQPLGYTQGREMGRALKALETLWIESDFQHSKEDLLATWPPYDAGTGVV